MASDLREVHGSCCTQILDWTHGSGRVGLPTMATYSVLGVILRLEVGVVGGVSHGSVLDVTTVCWSDYRDAKVVLAGLELMTMITIISSLSSIAKTSHKSQKLDA